MTRRPATSHSIPCPIIITPDVLFAFSEEEIHLPILAQAKTLQLMAG